MEATCPHCGTPNIGPTVLPGLTPRLERILAAVRAAGDLDTADVALLCTLDPEDALEGLEQLRDGLGILGRDDAGTWSARPDPLPEPELVARMWRARGVVHLVAGDGPRPLPWPPMALALPRVARTVLGLVRRGGVVGPSDLRTELASREGVRRGLQRLAVEGWVASDLAYLRRGGPPVHLWRLADRSPIAP